MAPSTESSSNTSNRNIYLAHIGAWCNLPLQNEHVTSLQLSDASSISPCHPSTRSSGSTKSKTRGLKPSLNASKASVQLAHTGALRDTNLEPRHVNSRQVSNHFAARPSSQIKDNTTTYTSKSESSIDGYDFGHNTHSTMMQIWLDEAHEEAPFVLIQGTQKAIHSGYDYAAALDSEVLPVTNFETDVNLG